MEVELREEGESRVEEQIATIYRPNGTHKRRPGNPVNRAIVGGMGCGTGVEHFCRHGPRENTDQDG